MDNNELTHWGIRGMRWGVRRYQNKDGSLTAAGKKRRGIEDSDNDDNESVETKRARVLKSTNASEIYKNRSLLTTAEINERLNRIDTERRLSEAAARDAKPKKTAIDRVNTALKYGNKINEVYNFTQTPVMKALKKKLFGEAAKDYSIPLDKIWKIKDSLPTEELSKAVKRANLEKTIKKSLDEVAEANAKVKQKQLDEKISKSKNILTEKKAFEEGINTSSDWNDFTKKPNKYDGISNMQNFVNRSSPKTVETSSKYEGTSRKQTEYDDLYSGRKLVNDITRSTINTSVKWKDISSSDKYSDFINTGESYIDDLLK